MLCLVFITFTSLLTVYAIFIEEGISSQEFRQDIDSYSLASFLFSTLEGAIMASCLSLKNEHMLHSIQQVKTLLQYYSAKNQED